MAQRNISNINQETDVQPAADPMAGVITAGTEIGQQIIDTSQQAKITENLSATQVKLNALDSQWKLDNQANPMGTPDSIQSLKEARQAVIDQGSDGISAFYMKPFNSGALKLVDAQNVAMSEWQVKQAQTNTVQSFNDSVKNYNGLANTDGANFGQNPTMDIGTAMNYVQARQQLEDFGNAHLGSVTTTQQLEKFKTDYTKSFLMGVAQTNPQKAGELLEDGTLTDGMTGQDKSELVTAVEKAKKQAEQTKALTTTVNDAGVLDIVNDPTMSYYDKRLKLDNLELAGSISTPMAEKGRRVIGSQKEVDAVTDTPVMSDITTRIYDLNAQEGIKPKDYLLGVQSLQQEIADRQAKGELHGQDAQKLNNEMKTLTSAKIADATKQVGYGFSQANKMFNTTLPPEYRGEATRQLFYATQGQNLSPAQVNVQAQNVVDAINQKRRGNAQANVQAAILSNDDVVKQAGYTMDDVIETANKHNTTPGAVIAGIRKKRGWQ